VAVDDTGRSPVARRVDGLAYSVIGDVPADLLIDVEINLGRGTRSAGIMFQTTSNLARGYLLR